MIQALHTAGLGMLGEQEYLDTTANNIANTNTYGYKKERLNFKDALYVNMLDASNGESTENLKKGTGVIPNSISKIFTQGPVIATERNLDVSLDDKDTFFVAEGFDGEQVYTRNGAFNVSAEEGGSFLVNSNGNYILDSDFNRIDIGETPATQIVIDINGNVLDTDGEAVAQLAVVTFPAPEELIHLGGNNFAATEASGEAEIAEGASVSQFYVEGSNVDLGEEMVNMIKAQRAYQLSSRVLRTADEMEGVANTLRK